MAAVTVLRDRLPLPVRRFAGHCRIVLRRVCIWSEVATNIRGITSSDRLVLRSALLRAPLEVFRDLAHWRDPFVPVDCRVSARGIGSFDIRANCDDLYHVLPTRERAVIATIRRRLQPGDTFVDAGANIGVYSVLASQLVGPGGKVIAIEMLPDTASILRTHLVGNGCGNATVVQAALSDIAGQKVSAHVPEGKFGQASITTGRGERTVEVETTTLADVLSGTGRIALIKMDLEGAELDALKGAEPVIDQIEAILFEDWGGAEANAHLVERGFSVQRLDGRNSLAARR